MGTSDTDDVVLVQCCCCCCYRWTTGSDDNHGTFTIIVFLLMLLMLSLRGQNTNQLHFNFSQPTATFRSTLQLSRDGSFHPPLPPPLRTASSGSMVRSLLFLLLLSLPLRHQKTNQLYLLSTTGAFGLMLLSYCVGACCPLWFSPLRTASSGSTVRSLLFLLLSLPLRHQKTNQLFLLSTTGAFGLMHLSYLVGACCPLLSSPLWTASSGSTVCSLSFLLLLLRRQ
jgi:uncharacterized integral membrane protein